MKKPIVLVAAIVAVVGLIAAAVSAAEDRKEVKTQVKIQRVSSRIVTPVSGPPYASYSVKGKVLSPRVGCRYARIVRLNHRSKHPGDLRAATNRTGGFHISWFDETFPFTQQHDRAKITRSPAKSVPGGNPPPDGRFTCESDRSPRFTIPPPSDAGIAAAPATGES